MSKNNPANEIRDEFRYLANSLALAICDVLGSPETEIDSSIGEKMEGLLNAVAACRFEFEEVEDDAKDHLNEGEREDLFEITTGLAYIEWEIGPVLEFLHEAQAPRTLEVVETLMRVSFNLAVAAVNLRDLTMKRGFGIEPKQDGLIRVGRERGRQRTKEKAAERQRWVRDRVKELESQGINRTTAVRTIAKEKCVSEATIWRYLRNDRSQM